MIRPTSPLSLPMLLLLIALATAPKSAWAAEQPPGESPTAETPTAETPTAETPTAETPTAENPTAGSPAGERQAADLLPPSTVLYAELPRPARLLELLLEHPLRRRLESLPPYREAVEQPDFLKLKAAVAVIEAEMEMPWRKLAEALTAGGAWLGYDAQTQGLVVLLQARDAAVLDKALRTLVDLARQDAARKGNEDPVKTGEYRGVRAWQVGEARFAMLGKWLVVTNKGKLGEHVLNAHLDRGLPSLGSNQAFRQARAAREAGDDLWVYFDVARIRAENGTSGVFRGPRDNPLAELLLGGLFGVLQRTPTSTVSVHLDTHRARLALDMPYDPAWVGPSREYFFGPRGEAQAPPLIQLPGTVLSASVYRDVSQMWLRADDLFDQQVTDGLAEADSNLSTLFSGKDFGEEILGAFHPRMQLIVARQAFGQETPQPAIKLPAFALVAHLKDPAAMRPELRRIFLSLIGFLNVVGAMDGQPQLDFDLEKAGDQQLITARYAAAAEEADSREARINYNFSPSVAFRGDLMLVASTAQLARDLLKVLDNPRAEAASPSDAGSTDASGSSTAAPRVNSHLRLDPQAVRQALADNRPQLIAQNMLENGHTREEAEAEVGLLLELIGWLKSAELRLETTGSRLRLESRLQLAE